MRRVQSSGCQKWIGWTNSSTRHCNGSFESFVTLNYFMFSDNNVENVSIKTVPCMLVAVRNGPFRVCSLQPKSSGFCTNINNWIMYSRRVLQELRTSHKQHVLTLAKESASEAILTFFLYSGCTYSCRRAQARTSSLIALRSEWRPQLSTFNCSHP